jgi:hypothetical protein
MATVVNSRKQLKLGAMPLACNCSYSGGRAQEDRGSKPAQSKIVQKTISRKNPKQNRADGVAQVVECLPSKHETLCSSTSIEKKKKSLKKN